MFHAYFVEVLKYSYLFYNIKMETIIRKKHILISILLSILLIGACSIYLPPKDNYAELTLGSTGIEYRLEGLIPETGFFDHFDGLLRYAVLFDQVNGAISLTIELASLIPGMYESNDGYAKILYTDLNGKVYSSDILSGQASVFLLSEPDGVLKGTFTAIVYRVSGGGDIFSETVSGSFRTFY
jgi:hypothetical protein